MLLKWSERPRVRYSQLTHCPVWRTDCVVRGSVNDGQIYNAWMTAVVVDSPPVSITSTQLQHHDTGRRRSLAAGRMPTRKRRNQLEDAPDTSLHSTAVLRGLYISTGEERLMAQILGLCMVCCIWDRERYDQNAGNVTHQTEEIRTPVIACQCCRITRKCVMP